MKEKMFITGKLRAKELTANNIVVSHAKLRTSYLKAEYVTIVRSLIDIETLEADKLIVLVDKGISRIQFLKSRIAVINGCNYGRVLVGKMVVNTALLYNVFAPVVLATSDIFIAGSSRIELLIASRSSRIITDASASIHNMSLI